MNNRENGTEADRCFDECTALMAVIAGSGSLIILMVVCWRFFHI